MMLDYFMYVKKASQMKFPELKTAVLQQGGRSGSRANIMPIAQHVLGLREETIKMHSSVGGGGRSGKKSNRKSRERTRTTSVHEEEEITVRRIFVATKSLLAYEMQFVGWVVNEGVPCCLLCLNNFSSIKRRHHCRACGLLVCAECSKGRSWLQGMERIGRLRVCAACMRLSSRTQRVPVCDSALWGRPAVPEAEPTPLANLAAHKSTKVSTTYRSTQHAQDEGTGTDTGVDGGVDGGEGGGGVFRFGAGVGTLAQETKLRVLTLRPSPGFVIKTRRLSAQQQQQRSIEDDGVAGVGEGARAGRNGYDYSKSAELAPPPSVRRELAAQKELELQMKVFVNVLHSEAVSDPQLSLFPAGTQLQDLLGRDSEYCSSSEEGGDSPEDELDDEHWRSGGSGQQGGRGGQRQGQGGQLQHRLTTVEEERESQLADWDRSGYSTASAGSPHNNSQLSSRAKESLLVAAIGQCSLTGGSAGLRGGGARSTEKGQQRRLQGVHEDGGEGEGGEVVPILFFGADGRAQLAEDREGFPVHVYNVLVSTEYFLLLQEQFLRHQRQHLASGVGAGTGAGAGGTASRAPRISRAMTEALDMAVGGGGGAAARTAEREVEVPSAVATAAAVAALSPCSGNSLSEALRGDVNITDPRCINKILQLVNRQYADCLNELQFVVPRVQAGFKGGVDYVLGEQEFAQNTHSVAACTPPALLEQLRSVHRQQLQLQQQQAAAAATAGSEGLGRLKADRRNSTDGFVNPDSNVVVLDGAARRKVGSLLGRKRLSGSNFTPAGVPAAASSALTASSESASVTSSVVSDVTIATAVGEEERRFVRGSRRFQFFSSHHLSGRADLGITEEMLTIDMKALVGRDVEAAIKEASWKNPKVLLGWQIMLFAGELGSHNVFVIIDTAKNNLRKTEYKISNHAHGDAWVKLKRSEKKTGVDFRLLRQVLVFKDK